MNDEQLIENIETFFIFCRDNDKHGQVFPNRDNAFTRSLDAGSYLRAYDRSVEAITGNNIEVMRFCSEMVNHGAPAAQVVSLYLNGLLSKNEALSELNYRRGFSKVYLISKGYNPTIEEQDREARRRHREARRRHREESNNESEIIDRRAKDFLQ